MILRIFASLLSIYILFLTAVPCCDEPLVDDPLHHTEMVQISTDNSSHADHFDHCSPFCTCNCCASQIVVEHVIMDFNIHFFIKQQNPEYTSTYISTLYYNIWEPPKIA